MYQTIYQVRVYTDDIPMNTALFYSREDAMEFGRKIASKFKDIYTTHKSTSYDGYVTFGWYGDVHDVIVDDYAWITDFDYGGENKNVKLFAQRMYPECVTFGDEESMRNHIKNTQTYIKECYGI